MTACNIAISFVASFELAAILLNLPADKDAGVNFVASNSISKQ